MYDESYFNVLDEIEFEYNNALRLGVVTEVARTFVRVDTVDKGYRSFSYDKIHNLVCHVS